MKDSPLFSIITVCFNASEDLEKTIKSVSEQSCHDYEYIVIDGGSSDNTLDTIKKYSKEIDKWVSEKDEGIYNAMNKGAKMARGKYLYFLNAGDTLYDEDVLNRVSECLEDESVLVYGKYVVVNKKGKIVREVSRLLSKFSLRLGKKVTQQVVFINRAEFLTLGGLDERYPIASDFDLLCNVFEHYSQIKFVNIFVSRYDNSGVSSNLRKSYDDSNRVILQRYGIIYAIIHFLKTRVAILYVKLFRVEV